MSSNDPLTVPSRDAPHTRPYRVLARAYRPQRLSELVGQDALVRTLTNAFKTGRIAHAFLLSGVRGVGKTTTARILAKGLNCTGPDGKGGPTPEPCGVCPSCVAIAEQRALDVIEMDAASQTGKADVLELVQGIQLAPLAARYKVYILDEVHMLSEKAWNALLKTVEEPPPHAKFVFATTEIRKVPLTVLSRCQRFELRRVPAETLVAHLARICSNEGIEAEASALELLAAAAEGSVRDALSLLDQAIAIGEGRVTADAVREMLGLADRGRIVELLEAALAGSPARVLELLDELWALGAEPRLVVQDLLHLVHEASRRAAGVAGGPSRASVDTELARRLHALVAERDLPRLARAWQILLKGYEEVRTAPSAAAAAEMVLLRLACVAEVPPPGELARLLRASAAVPPERARVTAEAPAPPRPAASAPSALVPCDFATLVARLAAAGEAPLAAWLEEGARLVRFEPGRLVFRPVGVMPEELPRRLAHALERLFAGKWIVETSSEPGAPTLAEQREAHKATRMDELARTPAIRELLELFPGTRIVEVRARTTHDDTAAERGARR